MLLLIGALGAGILAFYVRSGHDTVPATDRKASPATSLPLAKSTAAATDQSKGSIVLVPSMVGEDLTFKQELRQPPAGVDPMVFTVNEYLRQVPAVPKDGRAVGVEVKDRTAILAFNRAFGDQTYGSEDEKTVLDGIRATMGGFAEVDKVLLQVDGKTIDSLGHIELADALPVIRLATPSASKSNAEPQIQAQR